MIENREVGTELNPYNSNLSILENMTNPIATKTIQESIQEILGERNIRDTETNDLGVKVLQHTLTYDEWQEGLYAICSGIGENNFRETRGREKCSVFDGSDLKNWLECLHSGRVEHIS